ncbi:hypothetical protein Barb4_01876 [Bacteroidales bacterium Barb4]|nr:hypothetical protein Barb4_01876 [Bacteroidales bacterium Barb4]
MCTSPGSRKCTWLSMTPGSSHIPVASITSTSAASGALPSCTAAIQPPSINTDPVYWRPSLTILAFFISVFLAVIMRQNARYG